MSGHLDVMNENPAEQLSFWKPTVAETALLHLAKEYREGWAALASQPPPRSMDEISFACLMICEEHRHSLSDKACEALRECRETAVRYGEIEWLDVIAWDLALEALGEWDDSTIGTPSLVANLDHHKSGIRMFMMELAWFVRKGLPIYQTVPKLLRNASDTIMWWDQALGLCSYFFEDEEVFWKVVDEYQPEPSWDEQYRRNLEYVRTRGLAVVRYDFAELDAKIRRKVMDVALPLSVSDLGTP